MQAIDYICSEATWGFQERKKNTGEKKESKNKVRNNTYKILYGLLKGCRFCSGIPSDQFKERSSINYTAQFPHAQKEEQLLGEAMLFLILKSKRKLIKRFV